MKLFKTNNIDVVNYCRMQFNFELPSVPIAQRSRKFADKYRLCDNALYKSLRWIKLSITGVKRVSTSSDDSNNATMKPFGVIATTSTLIAVC